MYKEYYNEDNRANFIRILFQREFDGTDITSIKNFKIDPSKTLIPIYEAENTSMILKIMYGKRTINRF